MSAASNKRLEKSKERLRIALKRLEDVVEERVRHAEVKVAQASAQMKLGEVPAPTNPEAEATAKADIDALKKQLLHMQQENESLQNENGTLREANAALKRAQLEVAGRMDGVIEDVEAVLKAQGV